MQQFRKRERFIICAFAVLLCLTLVSFWMTSNIYARYTAEAMGSDSARVAKFSVTESGELTKELKVPIAPGESLNYQVEVTNNSEVAIDYVISAENKYENLPLEFSIGDVSDAGSSKKLSETAGTIGANDSSAYTYRFKVSWPNDKNSPDYAGMADVIVITLEARQKD